MGPRLKGRSELGCPLSILALYSTGEISDIETNEDQKKNDHRDIYRYHYPLEPVVGSPESNDAPNVESDSHCADRQAHAWTNPSGHPEYRE